MKNQPGNMKNQPGTMKNHENQPGTMNNQPGTMNTHENRPGTINKQKRYKQTDTQKLPIIYRYVIFNTIKETPSNALDRRGKVIWKKFESGIFGNKKCFFAGEQV